VGEVAIVAEAIIRKTCKELDIGIIDMAVNPDHIKIKGRSNRILREVFPHSIYEYNRK